ncbi:MAG TPA: site-2 protease family protein, partial [Pseudonocardiaceae bacterium]|nr:site-2 protease family protein [Pseudonocardiaceae bacterium]
MTSAVALKREHRRPSPVFLGLVAVMGVSGWAVWSDFAQATGFAVFLFVVSGWIVSLCLHEYAHARSALHGGDLSVGAKGYLTLNPLKYTHALLSIVLPVLFVIMGGIGLPGGAVFVDRGRIRGRWRHSAISAAGPLTNAVLAL